MADEFIHSLTDIWNSGATTFNAIKMNVTDTASASDSKLIDLQIGGVTQFNVGKNGNVVATGNFTGVNGVFSGTMGVTGNATFGGTLAVTGNATFSGTLTGNGSGLTTLNASNLTSGTIADARLPTSQAGKTFTSATQFASGTAALPGVTFASDTDTGLWRPGANLLAASTAGVERMRIDSSGNVLIGKTTMDSGATQGIELTPTALRVTRAGNPPVAFNRNTSNGAIVVFRRANSDIGSIQGTTGSLIINADGYLEFRTGNSERMRIDNAGNVGIGTTAPNAAALLDVTSTTKGFLPPRMTTAQRDAITSPPNGLLLYNTTTNKMQARAGGAWVDLH